MDENKNPDPKGGGGMEKAVKFFVGKGFYIVLFLCLGAIGISGYVILFSNNSTVDPDLGEIPGINLGSTVEFTVSASAPEKSTEKQSEQAVGFETGIPAKTTAKAESSVLSTSGTLPPETSEPPESTPAAATETDAEKIFYSSPLSGDVSKLFSGDVPVFNPTMGDWRVHAGIDVFAPVGTEVSACAKGVVSRVFRDEFKGVCVEVSHPDGISSIYCGLEDEVFVSQGDEVALGDRLGTVGTTATFEFSEGPHLHLEFRENGVAVDPLEYFYQGSE